MSSLSSVYEYATHLGLTLTSPQQTQVDALLTTSTSIIQDLCKRNLESQDYLYWYRNDVAYSDFYTNIEGYNTDFYVQGNRPQFNEIYGPNIIVLNQWPITFINVNSSKAIGNISCDSATISAAYVTVDGTGVKLDWYDTTGTKHTQSYLFATYKIINDIKTQIELNTGWSLSIYQTSYGTLPSCYLKANNINITVSNEEMWAAVPWSMQYTIENERKIIFNTCIDDALINYTAGYTYPVDNTGHTALTTAGNVPQALKIACIYMVQDFYAFIAGSVAEGGIPSNLLKQESAYNYSYTRLDNATLVDIAEKYRIMIDPYILKAL